jgi:hypothetical protein
LGSGKKVGFEEKALDKLKQDCYFKGLVSDSGDQPNGKSNCRFEGIEEKALDK